MTKSHAQLLPSKLQTPPNLGPKEASFSYFLPFCSFKANYFTIYNNIFFCADSTLLSKDLTQLVLSFVSVLHCLSHDQIHSLTFLHQSDTTSMENTQSHRLLVLIPFPFYSSHCSLLPRSFTV